jgi:hypothetical protein
MRHLLFPQPPCVKGCSVLYKEDYGTPFRQAHCQNYLFLPWGVPKIWLYSSNFRELRTVELPRMPLLPGTWVNKSRKGRFAYSVY